MSIRQQQQLSSLETILDFFSFPFSSNERILYELNSILNILFAPDTFIVIALKCLRDLDYFKNIS